MASSLKGRSVSEALILQGSTVEVGRAPEMATPASGSFVDHRQALVAQRLVVKINSVPVSVTAASDYGSTKLCDLPTGRIVFLGATCNLVATGTGGVSTIQNVDFALGMTPAASSDLSTADEQMPIEKIDAAASGRIRGGVLDTTVPVSRVTSSSGLYLNVAVPIATDGTVVLTGTIEVCYFDLGNPLA